MSHFGLPQYIDQLIGHGSYTFQKDDALKALGITQNAFHQSLLHLRKAQRVTRIANNFYGVIPQELRFSGGLPPTWVIDSLMSFYNLPYYIGILSAAAIHGASHQSIQELQVVTTKPLRTLSFGNARIRFFVNRRIEKVATEKMKVQTGFMIISTPEATAFDLLAYPKAASHLNNITTVLAELAPKLDERRLLKLADDELEHAILQRLGYLLDTWSEEKPTAALYKWLSKKHTQFVYLSPQSSKQILERDDKWKIYINEEIEPDL